MDGKHLFKEVNVIEEPGQKIICYRTALGVYEEMYRDGRFMAVGWNCAGFMQNIYENYPSRLKYERLAEPQSFDVEADGVSLSWDWDLVDVETKNEFIATTQTDTLHTSVTLKSRIKPLTVTVHTVLDGTQAFSRWIELKNTSATPMNINALAPMCGGVVTLREWRDFAGASPDPEKIFSVGYMDSSQCRQEGFFRWHDMPNAELCIDGKYKRSLWRHPMFMLKNNLTGTLMYAQLGWSGGYKMSFDLNAEDSCADMTFRIELASQKPLLILDAGETYASPKVHICQVQGDVDEAVNAMHAHIRKSVFTLPKARGKDGWIECGIGPERTLTVENIKHFTDQAAKVGAEVMIVDAGWYCPPGTEGEEWFLRVGDWQADKELYPNGLKEVAEYIHSKGLLFGLWLDLERFGSLSQLYREHPEWAMKNYAPGQKSALYGIENSVLNSADKSVCEYLEKELCRVIEEYGIDLFRLDFNPVHTERHAYIETENGKSNAWVRYYQNVYRMYENVRKKYPDVIFENCGSGGIRTDLGLVSLFSHTWVSDCNQAPRCFAIANGMTMVLPPETVDRLATGMMGHARGSLAFQLRTTIFGRPTVNDFNAYGSGENGEMLAFAEHTLDIYKKFVRPYQSDSLIFHHTPDLVSAGGGVAVQPHGIGILERASAEGCHGIVGVFALADTPARSVTVYPKGVKRNKKYLVTSDNGGDTETVSGYDLLNRGIRVALNGPLTSELITYEETK